MTIWTRQQVEQVRGTRTTTLVDKVSIARGVGVVAATQGVMLKAFVAYCHPFAVEVHPGDIVFTVEDEERPSDAPHRMPHAVRVTARWSPSTNEAEFVGGPMDGQTCALRDIGRPVEVAVRRAILLGHERAQHPADAITFDRVLYAPDGWNEATRRWVYRPA